MSLRSNALQIAVSNLCSTIRQVTLNLVYMFDDEAIVKDLCRTERFGFGNGAKKLDHVAIVVNNLAKDRSGAEPLKVSSVLEGNYPWCF